MQWRFLICIKVVSLDKSFLIMMKISAASIFFWWLRWKIKGWTVLASVLWVFSFQALQFIQEVHIYSHIYINSLFEDWILTAIALHFKSLVWCQIFVSQKIHSYVILKETLAVVKHVIMKHHIFLLLCLMLHWLLRPACALQQASRAKPCRYLQQIFSDREGNPKLSPW